MSKLD